MLVVTCASAPRALHLQPPDLLLHVLDLRLDLPNLLRDLLRPLAVAGFSGFLERVVKTPQLLLQSGQLVTELSEFSAVSIVLGRAGLTRAGRLSARRLSRSRRNRLLRT